jgi:hypothetical protein
LKEKVIQDSKKMARPKWEVLFDSVFLLILKIIIITLNHFLGANILILEGLLNFLPLILMVIGGIGSDQLKDKYI